MTDRQTNLQKNIFKNVLSLKKDAGTLTQTWNYHLEHFHISEAIMTWIGSLKQNYLVN